jgi:diguanylate cyclase (GGDEF)-like protein/PAS domain S-box-containing protein
MEVFESAGGWGDAEQRLAEERSRWQGAFETAPIGIAYVDLEGRWLRVNDPLCRLLGRDEADLLDSDVRSLTHSDDLDTDMAALGRLIAGEARSYEVEKRWVQPSGQIIWALIRVSLVRDIAGSPQYFVLQFQDITQQKASEDAIARYSAELVELARLDPLTGLCSHREFHALLDDQLEQARQSREEWSVILFDVDGFGAIAARNRHDADRVLNEVGAAIRRTCRASDQAARIGGDEFALILPNTSASDASTVAIRVSADIARHRIASLSFGIASWPQTADSKELLLMRAEMDLRTAQTGARGATDDGRSRIPRPTLAPREDVQSILTTVRECLRAAAAYCTEITGGTQTVIATSGNAKAFGISLGTSPAPDETHVAAPIELANGQLFGALCAVGRGSSHPPGEDEMRTLRSLGRLLATSIGRHARDEAKSRADAELAGMDALLSALSAKDHYTGQHSQAVVRLATEVARHLGLGERQVRDVAHVARLHDIGKVGIPDAILLKEGPLNDTEWELMRQHPVIGARILAATHTLSHLAVAVRAEHERFDGQGYPDGLRGNAIPLASRITFACDAYDAMITNRPYGARLDQDAAVQELRGGAGTQFDPDVVTALVHVLDHPREHRSSARRRLATARDVLRAETPRQTPMWEARNSSGAQRAMADTRAVCRQCGAHVDAVVSRASVGGNCGNCGSYELDIVPISTPQRRSPRVG